MQKVIGTMVENVKNAIIRDMRDLNSKKGYDTLKAVLAAYNAYQEEERDGVDYIFDINNTDDLKCCIDGGMTAKEIGGLYLGSHNDHLPYFYFGCNHPQPQPIYTWKELRSNLVIWLDEVLPCVLAYPFLVKEYENLYMEYVTPMFAKQEVPLSDLDVLVRLKAELEAER